MRCREQSLTEGAQRRRGQRTQGNGELARARVKGRMVKPFGGGSKQLRSQLSHGEADTVVVLASSVIPVATCLASTDWSSRSGDGGGGGGSAATARRRDIRHESYRANRSQPSEKVVRAIRQKVGEGGEQQE